MVGVAGEPDVSQRLVILGASNVARGFSTIVETARATWQMPLDVVAAHGHGRSYGMNSRVLGRWLPAILACDLWRQLDQSPSRPTYGLLTDIGNDLLYGASVDQIVGWLEQCMERLQRHCDEVVVTQLPITGIRALRATEFTLLRSCFFPTSRLSFAEARQRSDELNARVIELTAQFNHVSCRPEPHWYGFDPIHIRRRRINSAWRTVFSSFLKEQTQSEVRVSLGQWWKLHTLRPAYRQMFGRVQRCEQPAMTLADGTRISLF